MPNSQSPASPIRKTDDEARALARKLLDEARIGALATRHPETGFPHATRILLADIAGTGPVTLISTLAQHTRALVADPRCAVMIGEAPAKGDPMAFARMTISARAEFLDRDETVSDAFQKRHPKARLYAGFADFSFVALRPEGAELNGGFGRAYRLTPADLQPKK